MVVCTTKEAPGEFAADAANDGCLREIPAFFWSTVRRPDGRSLLAVTDDEDAKQMPVQLDQLALVPNGDLGKLRVIAKAVAARAKIRVGAQVKMSTGEASDVKSFFRGCHPMGFKP